MTLIGILLALLAEHFVGHLPWLGRPHVVEHLVVNVQRKVSGLEPYWRSAWSPPVLLLLAGGGVYLVDAYLQSAVLNLLFNAAVLFLCLGPRHLAEDIEQLIAAREAGDAETEAKLTQQLLLVPERRQSRRSLMGALFIQSHENLFGVLIWFIALGPAGAVLYRIGSRMPRFMHQYRSGTGAERASVIAHSLLAWVPTRVVAAIFGLAGSLDQAIAEARRQIAIRDRDWRTTGWVFLAEVSAASLNFEDDAGSALPARLEDCLREVVAMQKRALVILLGAYALFVSGAIIM